ncbi:uncharacterized protein BJX67DRAFT_203388 [Aspergillus lucknowensis]|uniref:DUF7719 domain-containing protein n=1 Tax=Aspergillus lucknowensis TaxID=176173 RepID=A0ABR4LJM4_9EURO
MEAPRNRKQRRAAAASKADSFDPSTIPLAHPPQIEPSKSRPNGRTLVDIIAEKQGELGDTAGSSGKIKSLETKYVTIDPSTGKISPLDGSDLGDDGGRVPPEEIGSSEGAEVNEVDAGCDEPIPPVVDTLLLSLPLTVLHLTLGYLAAHQYAQSIELDVLFRNSGFVAFPMLTLLIHLAHGHIVSLNMGTTPESLSLFPWHPDKLSISFLRKLLFPPSLKTMVFLPGAIFLGSKLMAMTNEDMYYAVMKYAPAIGTLWVWCILEIPVGAAILGALGPMAWGVWWKGYGIL